MEKITSIPASIRFSTKTRDPRNRCKVNIIPDDKFKHLPNYEWKKVTITDVEVYDTDHNKIKDIIIIKSNFVEWFIIYTPYIPKIGINKKYNRNSTRGFLHEYEVQVEDINENRYDEDVDITIKLLIHLEPDIKSIGPFIVAQKFGYNDDIKIPSFFIKQCGYTLFYGKSKIRFHEILYHTSDKEKRELTLNSGLEILCSCINNHPCFINKTMEYTNSFNLYITGQNLKIKEGDIIILIVDVLF